jgi:lipopolysaccharide transport system ATP-binding protein
MSDVVIFVENLGKRYRIQHQRSGSRDGLRHVLNSWATAPFRSLKKLKPAALKPELENGRTEDFWALKDVSFEVKRGEVVGIIGRNGAGKSTLLKILSRITEPTDGRIRLKGRVASLLEVGTGFHPELTGRENIFLNGAVLGMTKVEIKQKFDEIVAFAEIEKFLDTPVKRYSSGMYVRLAFAVAAHLEPEILIVDEVLAVGDAEFQKKCLGKMEAVSRKEGRTVLFVSHNMRAVQTLCHTGIVLASGRLVCHAMVDQALRQYLQTTKMGKRVEFSFDRTRPCVTFVSLDQDQLDNGNLVVDVGFKSPFPLNPPVAGLVVSSSLGTPVFGTNPRFHKNDFGQPRLASGVLRMVANNLPIHGGTYHLSVWLGDWQTDYDEQRDALAFEFRTGHAAANTPSPETIGFLDMKTNWSVVNCVNGTGR